MKMQLQSRTGHTRRPCSSPRAQLLGHTRGASLPVGLADQNGRSPVGKENNETRAHTGVLRTRRPTKQRFQVCPRGCDRQRWREGRGLLARRPQGHYAVGCSRTAGRQSRPRTLLSPRGSPCHRSRRPSAALPTDCGDDETVGTSAL